MYLDPGFGSMIIQVLLAAVAAGGVMFFSMGSKIKSFFGIKTKKKDILLDESDDNGEKSSEDDKK